MLDVPAAHIPSRWHRCRSAKPRAETRSSSPSHCRHFGRPQVARSKVRARLTEKPRLVMSSRGPSPTPPQAGRLVKGRRARGSSPSTGQSTLNLAAATRTWPTARGFPTSGELRGPTTARQACRASVRASAPCWAHRVQFGAPRQWLRPTAVDLGESGSGRPAWRPACDPGCRHGASGLQGAGVRRSDRDRRSSVGASGPGSFWICERAASDVFRQRFRLATSGDDAVCNKDAIEPSDGRAREAKARDCRSSQK